jgi:antirestriction protein ArdC
MPWHRDTGTTLPTNALTGSTYNGVNIVALWAAAEQCGFTTGYWATYKQWSLLGGQVRKGEKGSVVVFYKQTNVDASDTDTGERENNSLLYARSSRVFNVEQVDGWQPPRPAAKDPIKVLVEAERFIMAISADIRIGGDRAYYRPRTDHIQMPDRDRFTGTETIDATESYYATLLHELTHWTGHTGRLDRDLSARFGREGYAMEELVAELGAAFLCSDLGITNRPRPDHATYIAHWLAVLKKNTRAIFTAASKANEARRFLTGLQSAR